MQGLCLAAGLEVALSCDLIWAAEGTQLGLVEAVIGATPFGGGTQRLVARAGAGPRRRGGPDRSGLSGRDDARLGRREPGRPRGRAAGEGARFRAPPRRRPTLAHAATKRMIRLAVDEGVEAADAALPAEGARVMASEDLQNGARTLLEKGPGHATFTGR